MSGDVEARTQDLDDAVLSQKASDEPRPEAARHVRQEHQPVNGHLRIGAETHLAFVLTHLGCEEKKMVLKWFG